MPTITIDVVKVQRVNLDNPRIVEIEARFNDLSIIRIIDISEFAGLPEFAGWLINQQADRQDEPSWRKRLGITFHISGSGASAIRVVDAVDASPLA